MLSSDTQSVAKPSSRARRTALTAVVLAAALFLGGCFGKFALSKKVYDWNKGVSGNGFVQSAVMWALFILPVYEIAFTADFIILNPLELVTGRNPMAKADDGSILMKYAGHNYRLQPINARLVQIERDGELVGFGELLESGRVQAIDTDGKLLAMFRPDQVGM